MARTLQVADLALSDTATGSRLDCALRAPPHAWLRAPSLSLEWPRRQETLTHLGEAITFSLLPFSYYNGLDIELPDGVSVEPETQDRLDRICSTWNAWFRCDRRVAVRAERRAPAAVPSAGARRGALMFSGGVDSLAGFLRHDSEVGLLVHVVLSDVQERNPRKVDNTLRILQRFAAERQLDLVKVGTNVRTNSVEQWGLLAHGCALVGPVLALGAEIDRIYLSSTHCAGWGDLPWGSHPRIDPLIGTSRTRTFHDAYEISRLQKLRLLVDAGGSLLRDLRVCGRLQDQQNCGRCEKCVRTIAALQVLGFDPERANFSSRLGFGELTRFAATLEFRTSESHLYWCDILQEIDRREACDTEQASPEVQGLGEALRTRLGALYDAFRAGTTVHPRPYLAKVRWLEERLHLAPESLDPLRVAVRSIRGAARRGSRVSPAS